MRAREQDRLLRYIAARLLWRTRLAEWLGLKTDCGAYKIYFFPTALSAAYWHDPAARAHDEALVAGLLREGDVMVDVGANIGTLSLRAASVVKDSGAVYAIEANPSTFAYLTRNLELNRASSVHPYNLALGREKGTVTISNHRLDDQNAITGGTGVEVEATTLDDLIGGRVERIDLLKVDVEGFELFVLQGATRLLRRTRHVYFESCEEHFQKFGYAVRDVIALLAESGFAVYALRPGGLVPIPADYSSGHLEELIATRSPDAVMAFAARHG